MQYREIAPPPQLRDRVECFWTSQPDGGRLHRVLPDGCADILLRRTAGEVTLEAVGPMTRFRDHDAAPGQFYFGVRFRPGMWHDILAVPADRLVDTILPLEDLWGSRARHLADPLAEARSAEGCVRIVEAILPTTRSSGPLERSVAFLERACGCAPIDDVARAAGMSPRQFRRVCLEKTGLTPKFLARVLRFRHAVSRIDPQSDAASVALDCGYYDQAHLIRDFREFAGESPGRLKRGFVPAFLP
jgi:AraC-like DNA-binding protein